MLASFLSPYTYNYVVRPLRRYPRQGKAINMQLTECARLCAPISGKLSAYAIGSTSASISRETRGENGSTKGGVKPEGSASLASARSPLARQTCADFTQGREGGRETLGEAETLAETEAREAKRSAMARARIRFLRFWFFKEKEKGKGGEVERVERVEIVICQGFIKRLSMERPEKSFPAWKRTQRNARATRSAH